MRKKIVYPLTATVGDGVGLTSVKASDVDSESATSGQVLTANGAGGATWETPASGGGSITCAELNLGYSVDITSAGEVKSVFLSDLNETQKETLNGYKLVSVYATPQISQYVTITPQQIELGKVVDKDSPNPSFTGYLMCYSPSYVGRSTNIRLHLLFVK